MFDPVSAKPKDRLRCTVGLYKTAWMIGCPEEQRSRFFAPHLEHGKEQSIVLGSGWRFHEDRDRGSGYSKSWNRFK
jgi:hypothetical protein